MSHTEERSEIDTWEVNICDNCGHEEGQHYKTPKRIDVTPCEHYIASGCMVLRKHDDPTKRILPGEPYDNPYPRCPCTEFK